MTQEVRLRRVHCNYQPETARFLLDCDFSKQYDRYYRKRLEKTRPYLEYNCRSKWDPNIPIYNLSEIANFEASTSLDNSDSDSDFGSTPNLISPNVASGNSSNDNLFCNYKFKKRFRKLSEASLSAAGQPKTSTQNQYDQDRLFSDDEEEFNSPIMGAQRIPNQFVSPIVRKPAEGNSAKCIVIGTIFKRMKLQPDVVEELSKGGFHIKCERYLGHYTSQDDTLVLEDSEESIQLVGNINPKRFVTGIVVALLGVSIDDGSQFMVFDICFAEPNRQLLYDDILTQPYTDQPGIPPTIADLQPCYLMIVSGLGFHHEMDKRSSLTKALQNMIDFIWGGAKYSNDPRSSRVARILVAGNSLHEDRLLENDDELSSQAISRGQDEIMFKMKQSRQVKQYAESIRAAQHMDDFFAQLSKTINVDVMPGPSDPSSHLMPQQPFHPCMFPKSCMFSTFNCTTNPHHAIYDDKVEVLATSGQNVDIISKFSGLKDPFDIMKCHLLWGNSAPSAPDNLYSVPYEDDDPYVMDFIPDIYVAGCQKEYKTDYYHYTSNDSIASGQELVDTSFQSGSHANDSVGINITPESVRNSIIQDSSNYRPNQPESTSFSIRSPNMLRENQCNQSMNNKFGNPSSTPKLAGKFVDENLESNKSQVNNNRFDRDDNRSSKKIKTLLVAVPYFNESFSCVLINLKTLESQLLSFKQ